MTGRLVADLRQAVIQTYPQELPALTRPNCKSSRAICQKWRGAWALAVFKRIAMRKLNP